MTDNIEELIVMQTLRGIICVEVIDLNNQPLIQTWIEGYDAKEIRGATIDLNLKTDASDVIKVVEVVNKVDVLWRLDNSIIVSTEEDYIVITNINTNQVSELISTLLPYLSAVHPFNEDKWFEQTSLR